MLVTFFTVTNIGESGADKTCDFIAIGESGADKTCGDFIAVGESGPGGNIYLKKGNCNKSLSIECLFPCECFSDVQIKMLCTKPSVTSSLPESHLGTNTITCI